MRKGASYLVVAIIIALGIVVLYYGGGGPTGYAVHSEDITDETDCINANYTWEESTECISETINSSEIGFINSSGYKLIAPENANNFSVIEAYNITNSSSPILIPIENYSVDSEIGVITNSTLAIYSDVNFTYSYKIETCEVVSQCVGCDLEHLSLCENQETCEAEEVGGYWYNDACNEEQQPLSVEITKPSGTEDIDSGIPIEFTITGAENLSLSCWYNLDNGANTTLADCTSSSFDVPDEGDYVLNLYVNSSKGLFHDDSSFLVSLPTETGKISANTTGGESSGQILVTPSFELIATELSSISLTSGGSQEVIWSVSNTGRRAVSACSVNPLGDYASWITSEGVLDINSGEEGVFAFSVLVPEGTEAGSYLINVAVGCAETEVSKDFNVEVSTSTEEETGEGAPVGGFAIFGEGGIGVGGIIVLVFVVLALGAVLFFARKMRKSGTTLRDVFDKCKLKFP